MMELTKKYIEYRKLLCDETSEKEYDEVISIDQDLLDDYTKWLKDMIY